MSGIASAVIPDLLVVIGQTKLLEEVEFFKWMQGNQNLMRLYCVAAVVLAYLIYAPYRKYKETQIKAFQSMKKAWDRLNIIGEEKTKVEAELAEYTQQEVFAFDFERTGVKGEGSGKDGGGKAMFRFAIRNYGKAVARKVSLRGAFCYLPDCASAKSFPSIDMAGEPVLPDRLLMVPFAVTVLSGNCPGVVFRFTLTYQLGISNPIVKKQHIWVRCNFEILFSSTDQAMVALYSVADELMNQASPALDALEQAPVVVSITPT